MQKDSGHQGSRIVGLMGVSRNSSIAILYIVL